MDAKGLIAWLDSLRLGHPFGSRLFYVSFSIVTKTLLTFYLVGSRASRNEDFADFLSRVPPFFRVEFCGVGFRTRSERSSFSEPFSKILRDEVTLWVECAPRYTLDRERRIYLVVSPSSFRMRSPF